MAHSSRYFMIKYPLCEPLFTCCFLFVTVYDMHQLLSLSLRPVVSLWLHGREAHITVAFYSYIIGHSLRQRLASIPERQSTHSYRCTILEALLSPRNLPFPFGHIIIF